MAKVTARFHNPKFVNIAVDALGNEGITRDKLVISDGIGDPIANIKGEADDLQGAAFAPPGSITLAVEVPAVNVPHIAGLLKECGAHSIAHK